MIVLTEKTIAANAISSSTLHALKFFSATRHTGADMMVKHKLFKKTTISSSGYTSITWACKTPAKSKFSLIFLVSSSYK